VVFALDMCSSAIPYNVWVCESSFVADVLDIDILLLVSYDGKLGATDFSNERVNFRIDSSNLLIYYLRWGLEVKIEEMRRRSVHV
jgi:hypothetical protein